MSTHLLLSLSSSTRSNSTKSFQDVVVSGSIRRRSNVYSVAVGRSKIQKEEEEEKEEGRRRHMATEASSFSSGHGTRLPVDRSPSTVRLPGIQISRIDSFDVGCDDLPSKRSVCRSVLVESEISGEIYRISCSSEISLTTRSSRASSYSGSRVWDSEWDADVSIGSREDSQTSVTRQDWAGGPADLYRQQAFLSPSAGGPRRTPTVVSFDVDPSASRRRHSSPTECLLKCNECRPDAIYSKQNLLTVLKHKYPGSVPRKYSFDQPRIPPTQALSAFCGGGGGAGKLVKEPDTTGRSMASCVSTKAKKRKEFAGSSPKSWRNQSPGTPDALRCTRLIMTGDQHTDDSEIERRVNRLLYEIEHSVTDSVDESKIRSQDFEPIQAKIDIQTQTS